MLDIKNNKMYFYRTKDMLQKLYLLSIVMLNYCFYQFMFELTINKSNFFFYFNQPIDNFSVFEGAIRKIWTTLWYIDH